jgi:hypothetical protein
MEKKDIKKKIDVCKNNIKANAKDVKFVESELKKLLSLKGQMDIEPTLLYERMDCVVSHFDGDTFELYEMNNGDMIYKLRGGMTIVATPQMQSLNEAMRYLLEQKGVNSEDNEESKNLLIHLSCMLQVLTIPSVAFTDVDLLYDLASCVLKWLREKQEEIEAINEPQKEQKEDAEFNANANNIIDLNESISKKD